MEPIVLEAGPTTIAFCVDDAGKVRQRGFGPDVPRGPLEFPAWLYPLAYPTFGEDPFATPALRITNASGVLSTRLTYRTHRFTSHPGGQELRIEMVDEADPVTLALCLRSWSDEAIVEQWAELTNDQHAPVTVHEFAAAAPLLAGGDPHLDHFTGDWGAEFRPVHERLTAGAKILEARALTRPAHEVPPYVRYRPDGEVTETGGQVLAATLAWGGNLRIAFEVDRRDQVRTWFGHLPTGADYVLDPGRTLTTPRVVWAWSDTGTRSLSQRLHRWVRDAVIRDGDRERAIVFNNWEATFFSFDQHRLEQFCADTAEVGAEVFLLDDGWFGDDHPRDDDAAGLGDWEANPSKLPEGLAGVGRAAHEAGVRFGVWVEPEMVNPDSRLYATHPDWVVAEPDRERREERNQLQLDLCRPDVQEHVRGVLDGVLAPENQVSFVKWDANRMVTEPGSTALPADRQGNWPLDVVHATWDTMAAVAAAHPDVEMMACASGGGRVDLGTLGFFHEVWLSDNTDPVDRVRMQWHAAEFLPPAILAADVTRWGARPVAFACAVAMSARFGFDLDRAGLDDEEWAVCRRATSHYRRFRPLVQHGELVRLVSPENGPSAALAFLTSGRDRAVVFGYRLPPRPEDTEPSTTRLAVDGLRVDRDYLVSPVDLAADESPATTRVPGRDLVEVGLEWPESEPCTAAIWELVAVSG